MLRLELPARRRAQLSVCDLHVTRGDIRVLRGVDVIVTPTTRLAIVGENGRGKTTLLHVLAGTLTPDSGTVRRVGTLGIAEQEMPTDDDRTVGQAVAAAIAAPLAALQELELAGQALADEQDDAEGRYAAALAAAESLDAWDAQRRVRIALEALEAETDPGRRLADLSVGQRYRVRLACLIGADDDFLLLDEPTNHLDRAGLDFLTGHLRARSGGVVIVSHDRALLSDIADTVLDLDPTPDDRPRLYGGGFAGYRQGRVAERQRWEAEYERQQSEHLQLQHSLSAAQNRLLTGWRPEKGSAKHGRATRAGGLVQAVHRRQEALAAHTVTVPPPPQVFRFPELPTPPGRTLLRVDEVTVDGRLTVPVSLALSAGDRLVVTGPNGCGKSTLLAVAAGDLTPDTGSVSASHDVRIALLRQESALPMDRRAGELYDSHVGALVARGVLDDSAVIDLSQVGLLSTRSQDKRVGELSTGQQRRLDLALVLAARPQVLLLDEPTNHLSITLVDELTEALGATRAAVVLSTHDRQLLRDVADWTFLQ